MIVMVHARVRVQANNLLVTEIKIIRYPKSQENEITIRIHQDTSN